FSKAKECAVALEETSECFFLLADCFEQKGDFINALSCYQENIHWNKILGVKDSASFLGCAYSLLGLEKFEEALTLCEEISDVFPDIAEGWFYKGEAFYALNKIDEAEDCYLKALGMEENQESLLSILISLGNIYFGKEEFDQALINYNQAYLLKQDDDNIKLLISITSYKLNDKNKAFSLLKEVAKNKADAIQFFTNFCPESENEIDFLLNK
ncbi:MAG: tetratricopeptide repeat protein, partial [Paludibacteraceae bacterium]|nr:tetratricopeptide repeat protein [Paludibacteraceae bacterium]